MFKVGFPRIILLPNIFGNYSINYYSVFAKKNAYYSVNIWCQLFGNYSTHYSVFVNYSVIIQTHFLVVFDTLVFTSQESGLRKAVMGLTLIPQPHSLEINT